MSLDTLTDTPKRRGRPPRNPTPDYVTPSASPQQLPPVAQADPLSPPPVVTPEPGYDLYPAVPPAQTVSVRLTRHYRPTGDYEVVGWHRPERKRKNAAGVEVVIQAAEFVQEKDEDEVSPNFGKIKPAPPTLSGTGFANKILAGTVIKVSKAEARRVRDLQIGTIEIDDD